MLLFQAKGVSLFGVGVMLLLIENKLYKKYLLYKIISKDES